VESAFVDCDEPEEDTAFAGAWAEDGEAGAAAGPLDACAQAPEAPSARESAARTGRGEKAFTDRSCAGG